MFSTETSILGSLFSANDVSFLVLVSHLLDNHEESVLEILREKGYVHERMSEYQVAATLTKCIIKLSQWCHLVQCLKTYMNIDNFGAGYRKLMTIGKEEPEIHT